MTISDPNKFCVSIGGLNTGLSLSRLSSQLGNVTIFLSKKGLFNPSLLMFHIYRPQTKFAKVTFYTCLSVILFTGGCVSAKCMLGYTPPANQRQTHDPPTRGRHPPEHTPPGRTHTPPAHTPPGSSPPPCAVHAGRYGQKATGTHPTGMHTCCHLVSSGIFKEKNDVAFA